MPTILALRSPSFLPDSFAAALFESHLLWWIAFAILGAGLFYLAKSRANARLLNAAYIILSLTALWILAARIIDTPAERLHAAHLELAAATEKQDIDRILALLAPDFSLPQLGIDAHKTVPRDEISEQLKANGIKGSTITFYKSTLSSPIGRTELVLLTESGMGPIKSRWILTWDDLPGSDWKLRLAELTQLQDQPVPKDLLR